MLEGDVLDSCAVAISNNSGTRLNEGLPRREDSTYPMEDQSRQTTDYPHGNDASATGAPNTARLKGNTARTGRQTSTHNKCGI
jgi:hypothetical protein